MVSVYEGGRENILCVEFALDNCKRFFFSSLCALYWLLANRNTYIQCVNLLGTLDAVTIACCKDNQDIFSRQTAGGVSI